MAVRMVLGLSMGVPVGPVPAPVQGRGEGGAMTQKRRWEELPPSAVWRLPSLTPLSRKLSPWHCQAACFSAGVGGCGGRERR